MGAAATRKHSRKTRWEQQQQGNTAGKYAAWRGAQKKSPRKNRYTIYDTLGVAILHFSPKITSIWIKVGDGVRAPTTYQSASIPGHVIYVVLCQGLHGVGVRLQPVAVEEERQLEQCAAH